MDLGEVERNMTQYLMQVKQLNALTDNNTYNHQIKINNGYEHGVSDSEYSTGECITLMRFRDSTSGNLVEGTRQRLSEVLDTNTMNVWDIRQIVLSFLHAYKSVFVHDLYCGCFYIRSWLSEDDLEHIANLVCALYLENWLEHDIENYQTLYGFTAHPYKWEDTFKKELNSGTDEAQVKKMERAYETYTKFYKLAQQQARAEGRHSTYKQSKETDNGTKMDWVTLSWCDAWTNKGLDLLKYLFRMKNIMGLEADQRSHKEEGLRKACKHYQDYVQSINEIATDEKAPIEHVRKFVASSMMLHKLEFAHRFHLNAKIANQLCEGKIDYSQLNSDAWQSFYGRYAATNEQLFRSYWELSKEEAVQVGFNGKGRQKPYVYSIEATDIMDGDFYIDHMFCVHSEDATALEANRAHQKRTLTADALIYLETLFPPAQQHIWSDQDFREAAKFYRNCYPVTGELKKVEFPEIKQGRKRKGEKDFYDYYREIYIKIAEHSESDQEKGKWDSPIMAARDILQHQDKSKVPTKSKKLKNSNNRN